MKKIVKIISIMLFSIALNSCTMSTQELSKEIEKILKSYMIENEFEDVIIQDVTLVHESGNNYSGVAKMQIENETYDFDINVVYDGENVKWEMPNFYSQLMMYGFLEGLSE